MTHYSAFKGAGQLNMAYGAEARAVFDYVHASAQETPGALRWCPVCGQFYTLESVVLFPVEAAATPDAAVVAARQVNVFGERMVLRCTQCGAYAIGLLEGQGRSDAVGTAGDAS